MMHQWKIKKGTQRGVISYDDDVKLAQISFPDREAKMIMNSYLHNQRVFRVFTGDEIDAFDEVVARPVDSLVHMELALSGLFGATRGIQVLWGEG